MTAGRLRSSSLASASVVSRHLVPYCIQSTTNGGPGHSPRNRRVERVDLYEYQAKDLFAAHGVPVGPGQTVVEDAAAAGDAAAAFGVPVVVKAQVKTGGRGKAGGVKLADRPRRRAREGRRHPRPGHQGPHRPPRAGHARVARSPRSTTSPSCWTAPTARSSPWPPPRAAWRSSSWPSSAPTRSPRCRSTRSRASTWPRPREIVAAAKFPERSRPGRRGGRQAVGDLRRRGRHAGRGQPAGPRPEDKIVALDGKVTLDENAAFRHPGHADLVDTAAEDPLEAAAKAKDLNYVKLDGQVGIIGNGAGLVMSTLDVVAYAGEEFGGQARQLPRHRRRRVRRGDGQRAGDHPRRPRRAQSCSSTCSAASPRATRSPTGSSRPSNCSATVDKPIVVRLDGNNADEGRRILTEAALPGLEQVDTMDNAARKAAELAAQGA